ncbi:histidine ammonia-lyase [Rubrobacter xylanophilus DSM 9941]|uniref:Histidine ammonia-lyase n=1 Tax=Rubrobacter xylanophilus (strain DSM 9941 / JCM 11954 / NBRC 16129 / PRD-1) TaxID=266117 RepID=Q1AYI0_RUBXD|nr:histidine ammonia-lyase [Rubrobacter xylanophilus]ABG03548.1 histidine ammonia-lyase [Rubrobacter xylanophilus DSM 9941]
MAAGAVLVDGLDFGGVIAVARRGARVGVSPAARERVRRFRAHVERASGSEEAVYGVTTGFGALATVRIPAGERRELQHAILRSHAAGMGPFVEPEVVRAMMLIRAKTLAMGHSGVRPELLDALVALLNSGVVPAVPEHGSLGASGDLAPLAHAALCLTGEGWALEGGEAVPAREALARAGLEPVRLEAKEGLALVNGTDGMLAVLVLALEDLGLLLKTADVTAAMSIEALLGTDRVYREELHALRPHPGQLASARNIHRLLQDSPIVASHRESPHLVQDAYSLRCTPQVCGAARDTLAFAEEVARRELASTTDNPLVLEDGSVESCGHFHGEPLAFALDFLAVAAAEVGAIAERRTDRMLDPARSQGLPPFLVPRAGTNSGFMVAQYTAASLAEENRRLAVPASTGSLPTSAMQEDHVSMGWSAGLKLRRVLRNLARILAVEAVCAAQALDLRSPLEPAPATGAVRERIRREVPFVERDRFLAAHLRAAEGLVLSGALVEAANEMVEQR